MKLERFTTRYHPTEDRIRIDGADASGTVITLWFTQRLLRSLLPPLITMITPPGTFGIKEAALAEWEVNRANLARRPARPVSPGDESDRCFGSTSRQGPVQSYLIRKVYCTPATNRVVLVCHAANEVAVATIGLSPIQLRQWLVILSRIWRKAGWPAALWPEWLAKEHSAQPPDRLAIH